jgi:hypothetical protein
MLFILEILSALRQLTGFYASLRPDARLPKICEQARSVHCPAPRDLRYLLSSQPAAKRRPATSRRGRSRPPPPPIASCGHERTGARSDRPAAHLRRPFRRGPAQREHAASVGLSLSSHQTVQGALHRPGRGAGRHGFERRRADPRDQTGLADAEAAPAESTDVELRTWAILCHHALSIDGVAKPLDPVSTTKLVRAAAGRRVAAILTGHTHRHYQFRYGRRA